MASDSPQLVRSLFGFQEGPMSRSEAQNGERSGLRRIEKKSV